jgi:hypothetical protein
MYRVRHRAHPYGEDDHGLPVAGAAPAPGPLRAGGAKRQPDGSFTLRLDPAEWKIRPGDQIDGPDGSVYIATGWPRRNLNSAAADVDHVWLTAALEPPETP